ncbi:CpaE family protein [Cypionkella sp.]|uniref:AAA family ATPase n=1 Tax=Cypionkella sp. TaxID=2811411 RepID=UPI0037536976
MTNLAMLQPDPAPIVACTISRDVQKFDMLIDEMEDALGESWGDLKFEDALTFLNQPEAATLRFIAIAVNAADEAELGLISDIIRSAKAKAIRVILIVDQLGPVALHHLLRLGAEDFVPYPLPEGALQEVITRIQTPAPLAVPSEMPPAAAALAPAPEASPKFKAKGDRDAVVLPIHGLAGGCGASNFAVNLAWELATVTKTDAPRVCLLDFDFQYGSVATYLDLPRKEAVFELLSDVGGADSEALIAAMLTFKDRLHVLTAPADMLPLDIVSPLDISHILDMARANFDYVIIDMPKTIVAWTETVLNAAHIYFTLMDLDLRSAQNALRLTRALKAEGLPHEKLRYILNRAPKFTDLTAKSRVKRMAESLDISLEVQLPDGATQITQANDHGLPLAEFAAKNPLRKDIAKLAKSLFDLNRAAEAGKS